MKEALIGIDLALAVRDLADAMRLQRTNGDIGLLCPKCRQPVKPHKGDRPEKHFEHLVKNADCDLV